MSPIAFAWFLDDVLFPGYRDTSIIKPLFLITGSRSGSTQLSQYLEDNPQIVSHPFCCSLSPTFGSETVAKLLGRWMSEDKVYKMVAGAIRPEFLERKESPSSLRPMIVFSVSQLVNHSFAMGRDVR